MRKSILGAIVCAAVGFGVAPPTEAKTVKISGVINWGDRAPVTSLSAPGATSTFSFLLPDPISSNPTNQATGFNYATNGQSVTDPLLPTSVTVEFFTDAVQGLFDLTFTDGEVLSLYGPDIGTQLTIDTGIFDATAGVTAPTGSGTVTAREFGPPGGGVPEPSTWAMMMLGLAGLAFAGYRTSRKATYLCAWTNFCGRFVSWTGYRLRLNPCV
jgi:hypothetical protein